MKVLGIFIKKEPRLAIRFVAGLVAAAFLLIAMKNLLIGVPDAKMPADSLFYTPPISSFDEALREVPTQDFETRPLFSETRRPFVPEEIEGPAADEIPAPVPRQTLEGWSLLGIFDSGEVEGAIVRQKDGTRRRVLVGDIAGGWQLLTVEPRRAVFRSERSTDEAELTMSLVSLEGLVRTVLDAADPEGVASDKPISETNAVEISTDDVEEEVREAPQRRDPTIFGGGIQRDG